MAFKMKYGKGGFPYKNSPMTKMDPPEMREEISGEIQGLTEPYRGREIPTHVDKKIKRLVDKKSDKLTQYDYDADGNVYTTQSEMPIKDNVKKVPKKEENELWIDDEKAKEGKYLYTPFDMKDDDKYPTPRVPQGNEAKDPSHPKHKEWVEENLIQYGPGSNKPYVSYEDYLTKTKTKK
jgi:hypothetical protein